MSIIKNNNEIKHIFYMSGKILTAIGFVESISLFVSLFYKEWDMLFNLMIGVGTFFIIGFLFIAFGRETKEDRFTWGSGMAMVALTWGLSVLISAIPYYLSGHFVSYLDACFDVMSGFTTTGLVLILDLDHVPMGLNMWRHLITFLGGQGMVVLGLTFLASGMKGLFKMYVGEARDEQIFPNVVHTARIIWYVSLMYLALGTIALTINGVLIGLPLEMAFFRGMWMFMGAWSTGGFTPQSQNALYFHSLSYEIVSMVIMLLGTINFALHYTILSGRYKESIKNIEIKSLFVTINSFFLLSLFSLTKVYNQPIHMFRKVFYHIVSAHTGTGFSTLYANQFYFEWSDASIIAIVMAMIAGGSMCSTAGGFKALRIGIIFNSLIDDVKRLIRPDSAVVVEKFHHLKEVVLNDKVVRNASIIVFAYILTFTIGTLAGTMYGYPIKQAMFESASVTGNVGLSAGITLPSMPDGLKVIYIIMMWVARLEFMSVIALVAFLLKETREKI
ncbi:TrkH family potassium uptake protein [Caldicellulosiruptoraceae bacterium PP1]